MNILRSHIVALILSLTLLLCTVAAAQPAMDLSGTQMSDSETIVLRIQEMQQQADDQLIAVRAIADRIKRTTQPEIQAQIREEYDRQYEIYLELKKRVKEQRKLYKQVLKEEKRAEKDGKAHVQSSKQESREKGLNNSPVQSENTSENESAKNGAAGK